MTSKHLLINLMKEDTRRRIWAIALSILTFFFTNIIGTLLKVQYVKDIYDGAIGTMRIGMKSFMTENFIYMNSVNGYLAFATVFLAIILGISGFCFLFSKKQVDFYHSLPLSRGKIFFIRYVNGILMFLIPYVVFSLISMLIGVANEVVLSEAMGTVLQGMATNIIYFIIVYTICVIAALLTGNMIVSLMASGVLLGYAYVLYLLKNELYILFYHTYYGINLEHGILPRFCSIFNYYYIMRLIRNGATKEFTIHMVMAILSAVLLALGAYALYRIRSSEAAHKAMAFPKTMAIIKILIVVPMGLISGTIFNQMFYTNHNFAWFIFGMIFGTIFVYAVIETIYNYDFRKALSHKWQLLLCILFVSGCFVTMRLDLTQYDNYIPKESSINELSIELQGLHNNYSYAKIDRSENIFYGDYKDDYVLQHVNLIQVDGAYDLIKAIIASGYEEEEEQATLEYAENSSNDWRVTVNVRYKLTSGRTVYRSYYVKGEAFLPYFDQIYTSEAYKKAVFPLYHITDEVTLECFRDNIMKDVTLTQEESMEFIKIYGNELTMLSATNMKENYPVSYFNVNVKNDWYTGRYYIYPQFTNTIAFLQTHGFDSLQPLNLDKIETIEINYYGAVLDEASENRDLYAEKYGTYNLNGEQKIAKTSFVQYTSRNDIEEIFPYLVNCEILSGSNLYQHVSTGFDIMITYKEDEYGNKSYYEYSFVNDELPEIVIRDFFGEAKTVD